MSKYKEETLKDIRKRLAVSDRKKWMTLTNEQKKQVVDTYYQIRDTDYQNISFLLREHAAERKQFVLLMLGIGIGIFANPISSILMKPFPTGTWLGDLLTASFFGLLLVLCMRLFFRTSAKFLGEENVLEKLLEIGEQRETQNAEPDAASSEIREETVPEPATTSRPK